MDVSNPHHTVNGIEENGKEGTVKKDEEHSNLDRIKYGIGITDAKDIDHRPSLKDCHRERNPGDWTEWTKHFNEWSEELANQTNSTHQEPKGNSDNYRQGKTKQDA